MRAADARARTQVEPVDAVAPGSAATATATATSTSTAAPHALDQPVWAALTTRQAASALGTARALRYWPDLAPFAATRDDTPAAYAALTGLLGPHDGVAVLAVAPPPQLSGIRCEPVGDLLQMVAERGAEPAAPHPGLVILGDADAAPMLALATLTQPGPFGARTHALGQFMGLRHGGELIAMGGTRMQFDGAGGGHAEISAVCVHPSHRGRGHARALVVTLAAAIVARGDAPFLHVRADNRAAIALYEDLGFAIRRRFVIYRISLA